MWRINPVCGEAKTNELERLKQLPMRELFRVSILAFVSETIRCHCGQRSKDIPVNGQPDNKQIKHPFYCQFPPCKANRLDPLFCSRSVGHCFQLLYITLQTTNTSKQTLNPDRRLTIKPTCVTQGADQENSKRRNNKRWNHRLENTFVFGATPFFVSA